MSPRNFLSSVFRQCRSCLSQQQTSFSTSSRLRALKDIPSTSATSSLLGLDTPTARLGPNDVALKYAEAERGLFAQRKQDRKEQSAKRLADQETSDSYMRMMPRRWKAGDVYAPKDLGPKEARKWKRSRQPKKDVLDMLGINPLDSYQNFSIMSEYITTMGRIKHSSETGLRPVNQRKMAKAIRRAIGIGLHPSVHKYPEILRMNGYGFGVKSYTSGKGSSSPYS